MIPVALYLNFMPSQFDMILARPSHSLSVRGISYQAGKVLRVDKGEWDKGGSPESIMEFNRKMAIFMPIKTKR